MRFTETPLRGAFLVDLDWREDERGGFARTFCVDEFERAGLSPRVVQANVSYNARRGTLRGMHFQRPPHAETKVVRVTRGRIYDAIVDLRPASATYTRWFGTELDDVEARSLYVPEGFAHGFVTLEDETEVLYLMGSRFVAEAAAGYRHDDPAFSIVWPEPAVVISERDLAYEPFDAAAP